MADGEPVRKLMLIRELNDEIKTVPLHQSNDGYSVIKPIYSRFGSRRHKVILMRLYIHFRSDHNIVCAVCCGLGVGLSACAREA